MFHIYGFILQTPFEALQIWKSLPILCKQFLQIFINNDNKNFIMQLKNIHSQK